jgi:transcriptional regulator of arginine metabolism
VSAVGCAAAPDRGYAAAPESGGLAVAPEHAGVAAAPDCVCCEAPFVLYSMHDIPASIGAARPRWVGGGQAGDMTAATARHKRKAMSKAERHRLIQTVIMQREVATQRELVQALSTLGCAVTQATVSRDIRELDLQKVRTHLGRAKYVLSSRERPRDPEQAARHVMRDFARSTAVSQQLVVVRCEIGTANTVARQIDNLNHTDIIGTLAGDDTFVVIVGDSEAARGMKRYLDRLRGA